MKTKKKAAAKPGALGLTAKQFRDIGTIIRDAAHYIYDDQPDKLVMTIADAGSNWSSPEDEIAHWRKVADAFLLYCNEHLGGVKPDKEQGRRLLSTLILISQGDVLRSNTPLDQLSEGEHTWLCLKQCWTQTCVKNAAISAVSE
jgi:hypothetical protein